MSCKGSAMDSLSIRACTARISLSRLVRAPSGTLASRKKLSPKTRCPKAPCCQPRIASARASGEPWTRGFSSFSPCLRGSAGSAARGRAPSARPRSQSRGSQRGAGLCSTVGPSYTQAIATQSAAGWQCGKCRRSRRPRPRRGRGSENWRTAAGEGAEGRDVSQRQEERRRSKRTRCRNPMVWRNEPMMCKA